MLRSSHFPKRNTKKHSFFNLLRKQNSPKRKTQKHSFFKIYRFRFFDAYEAVALKFLPFVTLSSAAGCKLVFCGKILRSKTTKKRLTTCRAHEVRDAAAPCYKITALALLYEKLKKLLLAKHQTNFPKRYKKNRKDHNG
jgi:hypothetical protein